MDRSATVELDRLQSLFEEQRCRFYERLHSFADNDEPERGGSMEEFGTSSVDEKQGSKGFERAVTAAATTGGGPAAASASSQVSQGADGTGGASTANAANSLLEELRSVARGRAPLLGRPP